MQQIIMRDLPYLPLYNPKPAEAVRVDRYTGWVQMLGGIGYQLVLEDSGTSCFLRCLASSRLSETSSDSSMISRPRISSLDLLSVKSQGLLILMAKHHYLGFKSLVGKSIRYIAGMQGQWVALLGWSAAALKCKPRDSWIGWPQVRGLSSLREPLLPPFWERIVGGSCLLHNYVY
ncbi:MAG: DUF4338 domain-containing protein [Deltaproteobacteria bacterium]|nr:DUF4338 domain-containing protein [Deltaproteobacteria bacterium]